MAGWAPSRVWRRLLLALPIVAFSLFSASHAEAGSPLNTTSILAAVNALRAAHQAPPVSWDSGLETTAQGWASQLAASGTFVHSSFNLGENLAFFGKPTSDLSTSSVVATSNDCVLKAVQEWYAEGSLYDYGNPGFSAATGHFTQTVWVATRTIGAATSVGAITAYTTPTPPGVFVVMEFSPPGNIDVPGMFAANVLPIISSAGGQPPSMSPTPPPPRPPTTSPPPPRPPYDVAAAASPPYDVAARTITPTSSRGSRTPPHLPRRHGRSPAPIPPRRIERGGPLLGDVLLLSQGRPPPQAPAAHRFRRCARSLGASDRVPRLRQGRPMPMPMLMPMPTMAARELEMRPVRSS